IGYLLPERQVAYHDRPTVCQRLNNWKPEAFIPRREDHHLCARYKRLDLVVGQTTAGKERYLVDARAFRSDGKNLYIGKITSDPLNSGVDILVVVIVA